MNGVNHMAMKSMGSTEGFISTEHMLNAIYGNFDSGNNIEVQKTQNNFRGQNNDGNRTVVG
jgi:hypothetical protein